VEDPLKACTFEQSLQGDQRELIEMLAGNEMLVLDHIPFEVSCLGHFDPDEAAIVARAP